MVLKIARSPAQPYVPSDAWDTRHGTDKRNRLGEFISIVRRRQKNVRHIGVDGCTGGWIAVSKDDGELTYRIAKTASEVLRAFPSAERVLIDVPIGLPWRDVPIRPCDRLARTILGDRRSSVFSVPCRASVRADAIEAARELNKGELGRSLSEQSWGICRKIREVDDLLLGTPRHRAEVREIHPEVCFGR